MIKVIAYQVAEQINLKKLKTDYKAGLYSSSSVDLYYYNQEKINSAIYILSYGVVVFANYEDIEISRFLNFLKEYRVNPLEEQYIEDVIIHEGKELNFSHNDVYLPEIAPDAIRLVMLNVAQ